MNRIKEMNKQNRIRLEKGKYDKKGAFGFINSHLKYFLLVGVVAFITQGVFTLNTSVGEGSITNNPFLAIIISILSIILIVTLTGYSIHLKRSVAEKMSQPDLDLKDSSLNILNDNMKDMFKLGLNYSLSSMIIGIGIALIMVVFFLIVGIGGFFSIGVASSVSGLEGALGSFILFWIVFIIVALLTSFVISPFVSPLEMIYTYYGSEVGIFEAVKISLSVGWNNYGKLFVLGLKTVGLSFLGALMLGVGLIYTLPVAHYITFATFSDIFGVRIIRKENKKEVVYPETEEELVIGTEDDSLVTDYRVEEREIKKSEESEESEESIVDKAVEDVVEVDNIIREDLEESKE